VLIALVLVATAVAVKLQPVPAPLAVPATTAAPAGPTDGTWQVTSESLAGFRIDQTVLALTSEVVGRTSDVTGTAVIANAQVTAADLRVNLLALTWNGRPAPQFQASLDTEQHPDAIISLAQPITLDERVGSGATVSINASGQLTLHGVTRATAVPLTIRRAGTGLYVAGSVPIAFADWGIAEPDGYGILGSIADHGTAEFLLVLRRT
jgi:polyisoprenoid-binding protein YceI